MAAEYLERLGSRIRDRREELGLSRGDLARMLPGKTNENAVYRWEKGAHRPQDDALEALAKALQVEVSYFLVAEPKGRAAAPASASSEASGRDARIEAKLDALLHHFGISLSDEHPLDEIERELDTAPAQPDMLRGNTG